MLLIVCVIGLVVFAIICLPFSVFVVCSIGLFVLDFFLALIMCLGWDFGLVCL